MVPSCQPPLNISTSPPAHPHSKVSLDKKYYVSTASPLFFEQKSLLLDNIIYKMIQNFNFSKHVSHIMILHLKTILLNSKNKYKIHFKVNLHFHNLFWQVPHIKPLPHLKQKTPSYLKKFFENQKVHPHFKEYFTASILPSS